MSKNKSSKSLNFVTTREGGQYATRKPGLQLAVLDPTLAMRTDKKRIAEVEKPSQIQNRLKFNEDELRFMAGLADFHGVTKVTRKMVCIFNKAVYGKVSCPDMINKNIALRIAHNLYQLPEAQIEPYRKHGRPQVAAKDATVEVTSQPADEPESTSTEVEVTTTDATENYETSSDDAPAE